MHYLKYLSLILFLVYTSGHSPTYSSIRSISYVPTSIYSYSFIPSITPSTYPTREFISEPTPEPTPEPTTEPTPEPTSEPRFLGCKVVETFQNDSYSVLCTLTEYILSMNILPSSNSKFALTQSFSIVPRHLLLN